MKRMIDFLCAHLPSTVADMCIDFVEEHGDDIFDMLKEQMDPKAICTELGLCSANAVAEQAVEAGRKVKSDLVDSKLEQSPNMELSKWDQCDICQVVLEYLDKLLEDDTIEESIDQIISKACKIVPANSREKVNVWFNSFMFNFIV